MKIGTVFWITGLSGAGKSTLAKELQSNLEQLKHDSIILDGDELREVFDKTLNIKKNYSRDTRIKLALQYSKLCNLLALQGFNVIIATISMFKEIYEYNRNSIGKYIEIFIDTPISVLKKRDKKNIYNKLSEITTSNVAGLDVNVDYPINSDLVIKYSKNNTNKLNIEKIIKIWKNINDY